LIVIYSEKGPKTSECAVIQELVSSTSRKGHFDGTTTVQVKLPPSGLLARIGQIRALYG
jgi:hypothetical protein